MSKAALYVLAFGLLLACASVGAYNCLFDGSSYYPETNKAYCSSGSVKCYYPYTYLQSNCLIQCCQHVSPGFETSAEDSGDPNAGYSQYETVDSTMDAYYQSEVSAGHALKIGFNTYCLYDNLAIGSGDAKKIDDCAVECTKGYATSFGNPNSADYQERYDSIPPTLRQCVCDTEKEWYGSSICDQIGSSSQTGETPAEETKGPCVGVTCEKSCKTVSGVPTLYYDGTCVPKGDSDYECRYSTKTCDWGCESDGSSCVTTAPAEVTIQSPADGASIDTAMTGSAYINVTGFVTGGSQAGVDKVIITVGLTEEQYATYDSGTGKFTYSNLQIQQGKPTRITAIAMKGGTRMGSDSVVVYPAPALEQLARSCSGGVTMLRNSEVLPCSDSGTSGWQEGDEILFTGSGIVWLKYTDGTVVYLKPPARVKFWNKAVYVDYGGVEIQVNHDYEVLTKQGHYVVKGTQFRLEVPQDSSQPETLTVLSGTVDAAPADAPDQKISVGGGNRLTLVPGSAPSSSDLSQASGDEMVKFAGATSDPFSAGAGESAGGGCCGGAFVLLAVGISLFFIPSPGEERGGHDG